MILEDIEFINRGNEGSFFLIAGPCVVENEEITFEIASKLKSITNKLSIPFIFKASYRKANRSKGDSFAGLGDIKALEILEKVKRELELPIITDIHNAPEAAMAASFNVDILQIPAFLCRQTDLLEAAAKTGKYVNIKKGQFLSPESMKFAADKVKNNGNDRIILTERGSQFGYTDLIVDFRSIPIMKEFGYPVVMDVTHSLQEPNQSTGVSGGKPQMISTIARAAIAAGVDGLFMETHPDPQKALSDGANMLKLDYMEQLLEQLTLIKQAVGKAQLLEKK
ncbi:MAG: 3-deoxy-8-phosphooctulonate synthase [Bacteroidales bacterium]|nr:3-deoxy-8-phosphooctulonate synthase [Bacteroidales bacterium]MDD3300681.1 3-deoxy-8-phosphooctulonate synthase [Bacteroidales bacterium]MDD3844095.1 3-deoxy-8-phosphooctulonate synthase [Bacteroidales bacterium]MDD4618198.1 3-deoxy-8-phosphooctulonate synthase [Bacteroidales bacterium]